MSEYNREEWEFDPLDTERFIGGFEWVSMEEFVAALESGEWNQTFGMLEEREDHLEGGEVCRYCSLGLMVVLSDPDLPTVYDVPFLMGEELQCLPPWMSRAQHDAMADLNDAGVSFGCMAVWVREGMRQSCSLGHVAEITRHHRGLPV